MTGMEHAIEQAAQTAGDTLAEHESEQCSHSAPGVRRRWIQCMCDESVEYATAPAWESHRNREVARALAEAGLLAPAPLDPVRRILDKLADATEPPCDHVTLVRATSQAIHDISVYAYPEADQ